MSENQTPNRHPYQQPKLIADEVTDIRNQIWNLIEEMPMTRKQMEAFDVVKSRLWGVQKVLRELPGEPKLIEKTESVGVDV
jgi:hypothetical protein